MPRMSGTVRCILVADDYAFTTIEDTTIGDSETFILWWFPGTGGGIPSGLNSFTRIMHSTWISLLREARSNNLNVTVSHSDGSAGITSVQLGLT